MSPDAAAVEGSAAAAAPEVRAAASRRRELTTWLLATAVAVAVLLTAVVAMGGRIEAATWGLVVAAGAMVFALRSLYGMVMALARPAIETALEQEDVAATAGVRELREERRRVLRAINELQFDYEMGKLSDEDYRAVREGYELRAVEVMRSLESESALHPELQQELRRRGLIEDESVAQREDEGQPDEPDESATEAPRDEADDDERSAEADQAESGEVQAEPGHAHAQPERALINACEACEGANDPDAKFCKHCGAKLGAASDQADAGEGAEA